MKQTKLWVFAAILTICGITMVSCFSDTKKSTAVIATDDCSQFVNITDVVPDAILEIRYFGTYNFVGTRIDGYEEPTALLTKQAADSLKAVSDDVKAQGYRLKIYDAYRPQMGVDHFVRWAEDINDTLMKSYFYPDLDKSVLFPQEYICLKSGHTRGSTLDLTLFDMTTEKELDMGGTFDWFGPESHPDFCGNPETGEYTGDNSKSPVNPKRSITAEQFKNRMILRQAMLRHGFKPFDTEWWHFTLKDEPFPDTYFTFPVKQLSKSLFHFTLLDGLARTPGRANFLADHAVFVLGRVEDDGLQLGEVDITLFVEDALIGTHVDNFTNHTCTTVPVFIEGHDVALQRQLILVDDRCIHVGAGSDGETSLCHLVGNIVTRDDAEVVALYDVILCSKADGECFLQTDIVCSLMG